MSSSRRRRSGRAPTRRQALGLLGAAAAGLLAGCGFQPLYGRGVTGERVQDLMASVEIASIPGRVGQRLRNELIFDTTGGGHPLPPRYRLEVAIRESVSGQLVRMSGEARGEAYVLEAAFRLVRLDDETIAFEGKATSRANFDRYEETFSNIRARIDAENRAVTTAAENIRVRLAAFLSGSA